MYSDVLFCVRQNRKERYHTPRETRYLSVCCIYLPSISFLSGTAVLHCIQDVWPCLCQMQSARPPQRKSSTCRIKTLLLKYQGTPIETPRVPSPCSILELTVLQPMFAKKPKFKFELLINELSNIPHTSGYCYLDVRVGDSHLGGLIAAFSLLKPIPKSLSSREEADHGNPTDFVPGTNYATNSRCVHVHTSLRKIHNFKCSFNYKVSCNLRFPMKKRDNMVGDKFLSIRVVYVPEKSKSDKNSTNLGEVKLNLAEYLNFNEPVTSKYLLQDSKVNSILNLTTYLEELPADYEFHTQLHIEDSKHHLSSSTTSFSKSMKLSNRSFAVPQFQRKGVFGGLGGVLNSQSSRKALPPASEDHHAKDQQKDSEASNDQSGDEIPVFSSRSFDNVIVDPLVSGLYKKVLESTWDPELQTLLKLTPEKIVENIFSSNSLDYAEMVKSDFGKVDGLDSDETYKDMKGLIDESTYRDNLRSWKVTWT